MIYFLSDAHLGSKVITEPQQHQARLVALLGRLGKDADRIYLLGDIFDFWYEYLWHARETLDDYAQRTGDKGFAPFLCCLRELVQKGVEVHYLIGNHDIWTFGWIAKQTGVMVHRAPIVETLYGQRVYLAHGDGLVPSRWAIDDAQCTMSKADKRRIKRFIRLRAFFHHPVPQFLFRLLPPCLGDAIGYEWARRSRQRELDNPCPYKGENEEELVLFAKEYLCRTEMPPSLFVFGHRHIELDLQLTPTARMAILGDYFRQWTYASLAADGTFLLCNDE